MPRPTKIHIDRRALGHNFALAKGLAGCARVLAVIKANAHGHDALRVADTLDAADGFAVAIPDEAIQLREAGIIKPVIVLEGPFLAEELATLINLGITPVLHAEHQIEWLRLCRTSQPAHCQRHNKLLQSAHNGKKHHPHDIFGHIN
ncbi:MAG: alanine racemase [Hyphomonadaceae bacterium]|nr:alanine racemase [Hyphomonadaceae bacterium]MBC6412766.1 alanine racemase [Hyphomonadaceae bacterium]